MKKLIVLILVLIPVLVLAQDKTATLTWEKYYVDSLKTGTRDTVDIVFTSEAEWEYYQVSTISGATDTLNVSVLSPDASRYIQHAVVSLASGSTSAGMITGTTAIDFVVLGTSKKTKLRFTSTNNGANDINFIISGGLGAPLY